MKITVLSEDTSISEKYECEHGLCIYIEANNHRILFDLGASSLFAKNAEKLGIDIAKVDTVIISHGHYDHGGGLKTFLDMNNNAKIYIKKDAFNEFYSIRNNEESVYIGLDNKLLDNERFIFTEDYHVIDKGLELFSGIADRVLYSQSNNVLMVKENESLIKDKFLHEQNLVITEEDTNVLLCGCSHNGIINIINFYVESKWKAPDYVVGGFHLSNPRTKQIEDKEMINKLGYKLHQYDTTYFTCHCTGKEPYLMLKHILKDKIHYIATGNIIDININKGV